MKTDPIRLRRVGVGDSVRSTGVQRGVVLLRRGITWGRLRPRVEEGALPHSALKNGFKTDCIMQRPVAYGCPEYQFAAVGSRSGMINIRSVRMRQSLYRRGVL